MESKAPTIWLIAGPTAAGKSALAARLARSLGGEIVNADSMQLYADIPILSGQPDDADRAGVAHHLLGVGDAADPWSAGRWLASAKAVLMTLAARGRTAIIVGGTGLYFSILTDGLASVPPVSLGARDEAAERLASVGEAAFRQALRAIDPASEARIAPGDRQRLARAWSVHRATGRALSDWREATAPFLTAGAWRGVVLDPPRAELVHLIETRLRGMVERGVLIEIASLLARGLDPELPVMKALGLAAFTAHLRGDITLDESIAWAVGETRRYAKRQATWFRNQQADWPRIAAIDAASQWRDLSCLASLH